MNNLAAQIGRDQDDGRVFRTGIEYYKIDDSFEGECIVTVSGSEDLHAVIIAGTIIDSFKITEQGSSVNVAEYGSDEVIIAIVSFNLFFENGGSGYDFDAAPQYTISIESDSQSDLDATPNAFRYTLIKNNTEYEISGTVGTPAPPAHLVIPTMYNGLPVTKLTSLGMIPRNGVISLTIPASITSIEVVEGFRYLPNLVNIFVDKDNPNYTSLNGVLYTKDRLTLIRVPCGKVGAFTIPDSVSVIGNYAFLRCTSITRVIIPNSVGVIGRQAFDSCTGITTITIPESVLIIGMWAFIRCSELTTVHIKGSPSAGTFMFQQCPKLTVIYASVDAGFNMGSGLGGWWEYRNIIVQI
jgi:hypothetical protein